MTEDSQELLHWMICGPELARCINEFEEGLSRNNKSTDKLDYNSQHHEQTRSHQKRFTLQVERLVEVISGMGNPFEEDTKELLVLDTHDIKSSEVVNTVNSIEALGENAFKEFFKNKIINQVSPIFDPIKRNKLPLFNTGKVKPKSSDKSRISLLQKNCQLFSQLYIACQIRDGNLDDFFAHENHTYPPSLSKDGMLRSGTKSDLLTCLDGLKAPLQDKPLADSLVFDGPALVNILAPKNCKTFQDYSVKVIFFYYSNTLFG